MHCGVCAGHKRPPETLDPRCEHFARLLWGHSSTFLITKLFLYDVQRLWASVIPFLFNTHSFEPMHTLGTIGYPSASATLQASSSEHFSIAAALGDLVQAGKHHGDVLGFELMGRQA